MWPDEKRELRRKMLQFAIDALQWIFVYAILIALCGYILLGVAK